MPLLEVEGLQTGYGGIPVVFGIDVEVGEAEVVAVLGRNGAGKTSTLRALSGMIRVMAGHVRFDGQDITNLAAERIARRGVVHIPEGRGIFPTLGVQETLRLAAALSGAPKSEAAGRVDEAYQVFPRLAERKHQLAGTLSGGEQQMLAIARGLISRPKLLMIDEMSQGLAPTIVADLFEIVAAFPKLGVSVLLVEQFVGQALAVASRAYVLEKGEVAFAGPASKLAADEEFVKGSYLGHIEGEAGPLEATPSAREGNVPVAGEFLEEVGVKLPATLLRGLQERASREGAPLEDLIRQAVEGTLLPENGTSSSAKGRRPSGGARKPSSPRRGTTGGKR